MLLTDWREQLEHLDQRELLVVLENLEKKEIQEKPQMLFVHRVAIRWGLGFI